MRQTLKKYERLHGKKTIDRLFLQGNSFFSHPFIVYHKTVPSTGHSPVCAVLFSVGRKKIPHAAQRNLLKRRMKEVFRKNKHLFYTFTTSQQCSLHLGFIYVKTDILHYTALEEKMMEAFKQILSGIETKKFSKDAKNI